MAIDVHSTPRIGYEPARRRATRSSGGDDLDWLGLGRTLWRRKLFLLGFVVIVLGLTAAYVSRLPPAFEAEALVMLNDRQAQVSPDIPEVLAGLPPNEEGLQGQLLLIKSRSMAERMTDQLNLHMLPEFNPTLRPKSANFVSWFDPVRLIPAAILDRLPRAWADTLMTTSSSAEMTDQQRAALLRAEIVERVMSNIVAEPANRSTVIGLKFISTEPELAALGANTLARLYLAEQLETKQTASRRAREFLEHEIERLRTSVASAEQAIQDYRRQSGLGGALPDEQQLSGLTTQLVLSRSERAQAEARLRQVERLVNSETDLVAAAQLLDSPVLNELRARELDLNRQRAELSSEFGERHPRMVNLRAEQATLEQRKQAEIRQIAQRLRDEVQVLRSREATLEANIDSLKSQLAEYHESEIGLDALQRDADADRELLETYINRAKEIASQQKAQEPDARVISRATLPDEPTYPRRELIFGVALVGALLAGSLAVFGLEQLDNTFRSSEQIEDLIGLPALGLVPAITGLDKRYGAPQDYVLDNPNSPFGEAVRSLRTAMLLTSMGAPPKTVLLTSSIPGEGKTSMAMCLARVHARSGRRTLIVDCDVRRPRLHELTGVANQAGLSDVLLQDRELNEVVHTDERSGAHFVTAGGPVPDPAALLASDRMRRLLKDVASRYDLVIVDSPPVLSVSDARVLSQMVDKTVFLVHWGSTRRHDVMMGVKQLVEAGADMAGLVLSRVNVRKHARYSYSDSGYYYDDKYTKYYNNG
ncbi:MAG TPA: polysaccharide biosynthesis tyrosine autokinase [Geminicoccaceae bacterium]